ncbi:MAG: hypothetical protein K0R29_822 [Pseudobdellovibrio sp.]|jgi:hypothetical protein|nr:hypothetical protein [Pseudobdellovibrio sp.]
MKKLFTVILTATLLVLFFQNCAKKLDATPGFELVEKIPVGTNALVIGDASETEALSGTAARSMMWAPSYNKIELNLQDNTIKQSYYVPGQYDMPELSSVTTCDISQERIYQSLKALLLKQEICKYKSTIKEEDRDWGKCPMYMMSEADSYSFSVHIPETATHSGANIGFFSDRTQLQNLDPHCTSSVQLFCSESQGEIMDQLVKDLTDRFDSYTGCISEPVPVITKN